MPYTDEVTGRTRDDGDTLVSIAGEVRRELLRSDQRGRRCLRFSVVGAAGSTRCYWFLGAEARTERLKHGHRYLVRGEPRQLGAVTCSSCARSSRWSATSDASRRRCRCAAHRDTASVGRVTRNASVKRAARDQHFHGGGGSAVRHDVAVRLGACVRCFGAVVA